MSAELYRPANGTEGDAFKCMFCHRCEHDKLFRAGQYENGCDILFSALVYDTDEEGYPTEWRYDADGIPTCTAFKAEVSA